MLKIKQSTYLIVSLMLISPVTMADEAADSYDQAKKYERQDKPERAAEAYEKAADGGHLKAQNALGIMYLKGNGVEQDKQKARQLLKGAAEEGLDIAQYQYAELLHSGEGGNQETEKAIKWYKKAADQGHVVSMTKLGEIYASDKEGSEPDYPRAFAWYLVAKQMGAYVSDGQLELLERNMTTSDRDEADKLVKQIAQSQG